MKYLIASAARQDAPIYLSTNSGATWTSNQVVDATIVSSSADGIRLTAISGKTIYTSSDAGTTWTSTSGPNSATSLAESADGSHLAVAGSDVNPGVPVYLSTNCGTTWMQASNLPNFSPYVHLYIACSADGTTLVLASSFGSSLYVSKDFGMTWITNAVSNLDWYSVAASADGSKITASGSEGIYNSYDFGNTWINISPVEPVTAMISSADGNRLYALNGLWAGSGGHIYTGYSTPTPQLNMQPSGQLSWLAPSTNFVLQQSWDLSSWTNVANTPVLNLTNLHEQITLAVTNKSGFYRLETQ